MGSVVFCDQSNDESTNGSHYNTKPGFPWVQSECNSSHGRVERKFSRKINDSSKIDRRDSQEGGADELHLEYLFDLVFCADWHNVGSQERAEEAYKDSNSGDDKWEHHGIPITAWVCRINSDTGSKNKGSTSCFCETSKKIRSHTGDITYIVSNIVSNGSRITRIVFWDSVNNFSNQIRTNISRFGVDSTSNTTKHGNTRASKTVSGDTFVQIHPVTWGRVVHSECKHGEVEHENSKTAQSETHDSSSTESNVEAWGPSSLLCGYSCSNVGVDCNLHSKVPTRHRGESSEQERQGSAESTNHVPSSTPRHKGHDNTGKYNNEPCTDSVLGFEETFSSNIDGFINFNKTVGKQFIGWTARETSCLVYIL
mmetsp:Transcript_9564/g.14819  ORF Transcript_9564/g.14819 Transcript_9564/m.14819 type:complete len:368 (-) Transcript_9564:423-1526(-)